MGNTMKQLYFGREAFPSITCPVWNSPNHDTWLHVLLKCKRHHYMPSEPKDIIKQFVIKKSYSAIKKSRCYILINACTFNNDPPHKTLSPHGYYLARGANKDVIAMLDSKQTFNVWKNYHINYHHQHNMMIT